jgi:nitroreductase
MSFTVPVADLIRRRFSCREYLPEPIPVDKRRALSAAAAAAGPGPLGTRPRFQLIAAEDGDATALRGLGTYGFIRGAAGFLIGASSATGLYLEDYGYLMEQLVLGATDLGLGTCWLGGTFARSAFSRRINAAAGERIPAVVAVGSIRNEQDARAGMIRTRVGGDRRKPWEGLFFDAGFAAPLSRGAAGRYAEALDLLRLSPSASNKQPTRVVRDKGAWHFFLQRTPGYNAGVAGRLMKLEDIQRVDIGIAMYHFEASARELGISGHWSFHPPAFPLPDRRTEYEVSWEE